MKIKKLNKKADLLHENVVFIVLNVIFFVMMILFIQMQGSAIHIAEDFEKAEDEGMRRDKSSQINNEQNIVVVKGSLDTFYDYSYFNDVNIKFNFKGNYLMLEVV